MAEIPKALARITSHKKARYQLYQPGFNPANSCWLNGEWVTLTKTEWTKLKGTHAKLYAHVHGECKKQHHRNKATPLKKLDPAQRQAYEFYSGDHMLEGHRNGSVSPCRIHMGGNSPRPKDVEWLRREKFKFPRFIKNGPKAKPYDQLKDLNFPADLIEENKKAFDFVTAVVAKNRARTTDFFESSVTAITSEPPPDAPKGTEYQGFAARMAFSLLIDQEETIIRTEWEKGRGEDWLETSLENERGIYVGMRAKLKASVANFDEFYQSVRESHNECARKNLGDHGLLFCFVLPKFNEDGTHEPWGERDVPWGNKPKKRETSKSSATV
jgi:hypothetical protein